MKYYLAHVGQFLQPKNKLEKAIQELIKEYDRDLYPDTEIEEIKERIQQSVEILKVHFPKCTPIKAYWWTSASDINAEIKDWIIGGIDCVRFSFMCSKKVKL